MRCARVIDLQAGDQADIYPRVVLICARDANSNTVAIAGTGRCGGRGAVACPCDAAHSALLCFLRCTSQPSPSLLGVSLEALLKPLHASARRRRLVGRQAQGALPLSRPLILDGA
jgi:hypothetical protein